MKLKLLIIFFIIIIPWSVFSQEWRTTPAIGQWTIPPSSDYVGCGYTFSADARLIWKISGLNGKTAEAVVKKENGSQFSYGGEWEVRKYNPCGELIASGSYSAGITYLYFSFTPDEDAEYVVVLNSDNGGKYYTSAIKFNYTMCSSVSQLSTPTLEDIDIDANGNVTIYAFNNSSEANLARIQIKKNSSSGFDVYTGWHCDVNDPNYTDDYLVYNKSFSINPNTAYYRTISLNPGVYYVITRVGTSRKKSKYTQPQQFVVCSDPNAYFTYSPTQPKVGETVYFTDNSSISYGNITSWHWNFGDGYTSSSQNPTHSYSSAGTYTVTLTVTNSCGKSDSYYQYINVEENCTMPNAYFTYSPLSPKINETINFYDQSSAGTGSITSWHWDFGDGYSSSSQNPTHSYSSAGTYTVSLTVTNSCGKSDSYQRTLTVSETPKPEITNSYASDITTNSAILHATINPNGSQTTYYFQYGTDNNYGTQTSTNTLSSSNSDIPVSVTITGLNPNTTYHFRCVACNDGGCTYGEDVTFKTNSNSYLEVSPDSINVPYIAGDSSITVNSNIVWTATTNNDWIDIISSKGTGNGKVEFRYYENNSTVPRSGEIIIAGDNLSRTVKIRQDGKDFDLQVSDININPNPLIHGQPADIKATVKNIGNSDFYGTIFMSWHKGDGSYITDLASKQNLKKGETYTLTFHTDGIISQPDIYKVIIKYTTDNQIYIVLSEKDVRVISQDNDNNKKIVGYLPSYEWVKRKMIDYQKITHLNLAFVNPNSSLQPEMSDNLTKDTLKNFIEYARSINPDIKVFISIGGHEACRQDRPTYNYYETIFGNASNRQSYINELLNYVNDIGADGIDVDIEWKALELNGFNDFVIELAQTLHSNNKLISIAAEEGTWGDKISDAALSNVDWVNAMAYNNTQADDYNASYQFFIDNFNYWLQSRNMPSSKIVLGVPFYGRDKNTNEYSFCSIIEPYDDPTTIDQYVIINHPRFGTTIYWNGPNAIKEKTIFARDHANGIMIWELAQGICDFNYTNLLAIIYNNLFGINSCYTQLTGYDLPVLTFPLPGGLDNYNVVLGYGDTWTWGECGGKDKIHNAWDLVSKTGSTVNKEVYACYDGYVKAIYKLHPVNNWAKGIIIEHEYNGIKFTTGYLHIDPIQGIKVGDYVKRGQVIGHIANIDNPHLHFDIRKHEYTNPYAKRGALPSSEVADDNCKCNDGTYYDPVFPEYFINPATVKFQNNLTSVQNLDKNFYIYPNPANDYLIIKAYQIRKIEVLGLTGKRFISKSLPYYSSYKLNISNLPKGIYIVKIQSKSRIQSKFFIKL